MSHFAAFLQYHLSQTWDQRCMAWHVTSSSDGPDTRRQWRVFNTPPAFDATVSFKSLTEAYKQWLRLCHPLRKGARVSHIVLPAHPHMAGLCLAETLVYFFDTMFW